MATKRASPVVAHVAREAQQTPGRERKAVRGA
jgi:hypothetical protein